METTRIKVRIGDAEFEAEGPQELITKQFDSFMAVVSATPKKEPTAPPSAAVGGPTQPASGAAPPTPASEVASAVMERVFRQGDTLSLAALPNGENASSDAMLALLYGYMKIKNETTVTGTSLMKSAKLSGVSVDRVDRLMAANQDLVLAAGVRKARRYQLNNRGIARAAQIINAILQ